eukprot:CAMPEP_0183402208 /NCGR_PEP_ID=MMETSP0370-20130417/13749_1 /TAXON_ID=268820 /ORGANISM="Peridinium aciculiferum, Strain PAER-2" /LENGTH=839 /DNA_ID=CAMNT_0025583755 /DNA_START=1 /DNA_END=2520 /DNA_ORIENTATION=-
MGILRSELMKHGTLVLPIDRARHFIDLIGHKTKMQFEDMNSRDLSRPYKKYVQRIDEMERILRFLLEELNRVPDAEVIKNNMDSFLDHSDDHKLDDVEARLKQMYKEFIQFKENNTTLTAARNAALEERYVVQTALASMANIRGPASSRAHGNGSGDDFEFAATRSLLDDEEGGRSRLETMFSNTAGVIEQANQDRFARSLFRATRGNTFTHFQQIFEPMVDPKTGREVSKAVFVIYFQDNRMGGQTSAMSEKIQKICASYGVNTYRWPAHREAAQEVLTSLQVQVEDQQRLLRAHESFVLSEASALLAPLRLGGNSLIEDWRLFCKKEKSIYATLNLFEGDMNLRANCWYPEAQEQQIQGLLSSTMSQTGQNSAVLISHRTPPRKSPPTYIRTNEFTAVFQELVDTYGLPNYGEANPALFTIVTFPFLFGVMYGDVGHGSMLLSVGLFAVWKAEDIKHTIPDLYYARYIVTMMGLFAIYVGFLYNDFFSLGFSFFTSRWVEVEGGHPGPGGIISYEPAPWFDTKNEGGVGPYPFGVDPAWHGAQNELIYMNSLKMKISVILGVSQMIVGLLLRFANAIHNNSPVDLVFECVPMMLFMVCFFGFMDYMILYKWVTPMPNPPSIINSLIAMAMWGEDLNPMLGAELPRILMAVSMLAVPFMLIPKPLIKLWQHNKEVAARSSRGHGGMGGGSGRHAPVIDEEACPLGLEEDEGEQFEFGELVIHQVIETIEYVLGTVSHTASYLRLWALSLAHQQLSTVFFGMTLLSGMTAPFPLNVLSLYFCFMIWFGITLAILLGMDVLECFLHVLRLHWVEFQSKFYKAQGHAFEPYCHRTLLVKEE